MLPWLPLCFHRNRPQTPIRVSVFYFETMNELVTIKSCTSPEGGGFKCHDEGRCYAWEVNHAASRMLK